MVNNMEELIKDIVSGKIKQQYAKDRFNTIVESNVNKRNVNSWFKKYTKNQDKILSILSMLKEIFTGKNEYEKKAN